MLSPLHAALGALALLLFFTVGEAAAQAEAGRWPNTFGGDDPPAALDETERVALDALRAAMIEAGASPCRSSARLTAAARAHARELLNTQTTHRLTPRSVRLEVLRAGAVDPVVIPWALAFRGDLDLSTHRERLLRRFGRRPPSHCGVGVAVDEGRSVVALIGVRRNITLEELPARLARGDRVRVQGRLGLAFRSPAVLVTTPLGDVIEHQTLRRSGAFGAWLDFTMSGHYTVEVMATGEQGPQIVALFPVFVDVEPSVAGEVRSQPSSSHGASLSSVDDLFAALNRARRDAQLEPLDLDRELTELALAHSRDMLERSYFGHLSPTGEDLRARLQTARLGTSRAAENLVRASSFANAHAQLMESPSHRANLLDPEVTHVGIGAVEREGELLITQIFVSW
jgi:uncharacterized protein YkwD